MAQETLPRVILVDLDGQGGMAAAVEESLKSRCCLVREEKLSPSGETAISSVGSVDLVAAVVCVSAIDAATESKITLKLSQLHELPVLLVSDDWDAVVLGRLLWSGVSDFALRPFHKGEIATRVERLIGPTTESRTGSAPSGIAEHPLLTQYVGVGKAFRKLIDKMMLAARCDSTVLLQGETGTGKEVCARAIHQMSSRSGNPFVPVNCGAIPLDLIENELFGHETGAYTDAGETREGLVHEAEGGTLFLDEVDSLPPSAQVKLLRLLQESEYRPLGSTKTRKADLRLVAATNANVREAVRSGTIRDDFYFRLNVFPLTIPPLRERGEDVLPLARHFLRKVAAKLRRPSSSLSSGAVAKLLAYDWPGNVRELEHVIEHALVVSENRIILTEREIILSDKQPSFEASYAEAKARFERAYVEKLVAAHDGSVSGAASSAGMHRETLRRLIQRHGIDLARFRANLP